ncbi:hypothetical protein Hdeb2414_s0001g00007491 [Helianthus debilis subsp. tardiflorus]
MRLVQTEGYRFDNRKPDSPAFSIHLLILHLRRHMVELILHLSRCVIGIFSIPNLTSWRGTSSWYSKVKAWRRGRVKRSKYGKKSVAWMRGKCNLHTYVKYSFIIYVINGITVILEIWIFVKITS